MKILETGIEIGATISNLIKRSTKIEMAVAWASTSSDCFEHLKKARDRIHRLTVGVHFYQTDPEFLVAFQGSNFARVVKQTSGVYHPKIYFFELDDQRWQCVIGSANFTRGAFTLNQESAVLISSDDAENEKHLETIKRMLEGYWNCGSQVDSKFVEAYKRAHAAKKPKIDDLRATFGQSDIISYQNQSKSVFESKIFSMSWSEFAKNVEHDKTHGLEDRLKVLEEAKRLFKKHQSFNKMGDEERKNIAGYLETSDVRWKYFGSMFGAGTFKNRVGENDKNISLALDKIPLHGHIEKRDYVDFLTCFKRAFPASKNMLGTSSRLLSMKRPDYFICLDQKNKSAFCKDFGISVSKLTDDNYWEEVVERIMSCIWWEEPEPPLSDDLGRQIWAGRAAFLDAIYYTP